MSCFRRLSLPLSGRPKLFAAGVWTWCFVFHTTELAAHPRIVVRVERSKCESAKIKIELLFVI